MGWINWEKKKVVAKVFSLQYSAYYPRYNRPSVHKRLVKNVATWWAEARAAGTLSSKQLQDSTPNKQKSVHSTSLHIRIRTVLRDITDRKSTSPVFNAHFRCSLTVTSHHPPMHRHPSKKKLYSGIVWIDCPLLCELRWTVNWSTSIVLKWRHPILRVEVATSAMWSSIIDSLIQLSSVSLVAGLMGGRTLRRSLSIIGQNVSAPA